MNGSVSLESLSFSDCRETGTTFKSGILPSMKAWVTTHGRAIQVQIPTRTHKKKSLGVASRAGKKFTASANNMLCICVLLLLGRDLAGVCIF